MMIGNFNKRVNLQTEANTISASGGSTKAFTTFSSVWAMFKEGDSRPVEQGSQEQLNRTGKITIRYSSVIKANLSKDTRIVLEGVNWAVTGLKQLDKDYVEIEVVTLLNSL